MASPISYKGLSLSDSPSGAAGIALNANFTQIVDSSPLSNSTTTNPVVGSDVNAGYYPGSRWLNTSTSQQWICISNSASAAVWKQFTGSLLAANNLSDLAVPATARTNLGVAIGSNVQAWSATLDSLAAGSYAGSAAITMLGTIGTGTWQGSVIAGQYGGTGVANTGKTITLGGNLVTSGAFATTLTATATTSVTLPVSGTLLSTTSSAGSFPTLNQNTSGTAAGLSVTLVPTSGGTGLATYSQGDLLYGSASNALSALAKSATATRYLANTGASNSPAWDQINLANGVTGVLPFANLTNASAASKLFGRGSASGAGAFQEITLGTNLSMSGTTLNATGGGGGGGSQGTGLQYGDGAGGFLGDNALTTNGIGALQVVTLNASSGISLNGSSGQIQYQGSTFMTGDSALTDGAGNWTNISSLAIKDAGSGRSVTLIASSPTTVYTFTLPANGGSNGFFLQTNGSGVTAWSAVFNQSLNTSDSPTFVTLNATSLVGGGSGITGLNYSQLSGNPGNPFNQSLNTGDSPSFSGLTLAALSATAGAISAVDPTTTAIGTLLTTVANYIGQGNALMTDAPEWLLITTPSGALRKIPVYAP